MSDIVHGQVVGVITPNGQIHKGLVQRVWDDVPSYISPVNGLPAVNAVYVNPAADSEDPAAQGGSYGRGLVRETSLMHYTHNHASIAERCYFLDSEQDAALKAMEGAKAGNLAPAEAPAPPPPPAPAAGTQTSTTTVTNPENTPEAEKERRKAVAAANMKAGREKAAAARAAAKAAKDAATAPPAAQS